MKKVLLAISAIAVAVTLVSCGGNSSSKPATVEESAVEKFEQMYQAGENRDLEKFTKLAKDFDAWLKTLSEEDANKAHDAVMTWDKDKAKKVMKAARKVLKK